ncbi:hypothetical protein pb186bvf_011569 [Paramecium bursaria]
MDCHQPVCEKEDVKNFRQTKKSRLDFDDTPQCPLGRNTLGLYTWNFLHTMAIYYPDNPTQEQQTKMINFIDGLAEFYPCNVCKTDFQQDIIKNPPLVQNRQELSIWFCQRHNEVNQKLGKNIYDCSFQNLEYRWRTGCK